MADAGPTASGRTGGADLVLRSQKLPRHAGETKYAAAEALSDEPGGLGYATARKGEGQRGSMSKEGGAQRHDCARAGRGGVAHLDQAVAMRDSKHPTGAVLIFTPAEWTAFVTGAKAGEFDQ